MSNEEHKPQGGEILDDSRQGGVLGRIDEAGEVCGGGMEGGSALVESGAAVVESVETTPEENAPAGEILADIRRSVVLGRIDESDEGFDGGLEGEPGVVELVETALEAEVPVGEILAEGLSPAMEEVGSRFESKEFLIPDMLASAECVSAAMDILEPHLVSSGVERKGKVVIATVEGDLHDIGKNIVATLLKGAGYEVRDLGTSVPATAIVEEVRSQDADVLGLSALLTSTMTKMKLVLDELVASGLRGKVKVIVGG
ncbi:MAG: cobalamin-dependent protein, partial [Planctomycetes bacterium]|nr:cobalamin-dependent protein [Planctomycetota bacterium]